MHSGRSLYFYAEATEGTTEINSDKTKENKRGTVVPLL
jgi:hypothetical protein